MSGHKRATITANTDNIRQMSQAEMSIRFVEAGLNVLSDRLNDYAQQNREAEAIQAELAQEVLIQTLAQVDEAFSEMEEQSQSALAEQQEIYFQQLSVINEQVEQINAQHLDQLSAQYQSAIDEVARRNEEALVVVAEKLQVISQERKSKTYHIRKWIEAVGILYQSILEDPFIEIVYPGFTNHIAAQIRDAEDDLHSGYYDAALMCAKNSYREISTVKIQAEQERQQYQHLKSLLWKKLELLEQELKINQRVRVFDLQGNPLPNEITVDDWVSGKMSLLLERIIKTQTLISRPVSPGQIDKLKQVLNHKLPQWQVMMKDYVFQARSEVINSQLRMNIALMVVRALSNQGYKLLLTNYAGNDMRSDYQAQLVDNEGSEILVQVEPAGSQPQTAELNLYTQDADKRTPHELRQRALEIQRSIRRAGLTISELSPVEQAPQPFDLSNRRVKQELQQKQVEYDSSKR